MSRIVLAATFAAAATVWLRGELLPLAGAVVLLALAGLQELSSF